MPSLDVSEVLFSHEFMDLVDVLRQEEEVNDFGESVITPRRIKGIEAVITGTAPNDLERGTDYTRMPRSRTIITTFRLRGPSPGTQPDHVIWQGSEYVINEVEPYTQYGNGFVEATMTSIRKVDPAPGACK